MVGAAALHVLPQTLLQLFNPPFMILGCAVHKNGVFSMNPGIDLFNRLIPSICSKLYLVVHDKVITGLMLITSRLISFFRVRSSCQMGRLFFRPFKYFCINLKTLKKNCCISTSGTMVIRWFITAADAF